MNLQPFSRPLEMRVIRTICNLKSQKAAARLFSSLRADCFHTQAGKNCYTRINTLMMQRGDNHIDWNELVHDTVLPDTVRKYISRFKKKPLTEDQIPGALKRLHNYRQIRGLARMSNDVLVKLQQGTVDVHAIREAAADAMVDIGSTSDTASWFTHIGGEDKSGIRLMKKALKGVENLYIPTGIKSFDKKNIGISRGSLFLIGGPTGGGKTIVAGQIAENMARSGAKVCMVPLEMSDVESAQRHLSRTSQTSMSKIIDPAKRIDRKQQKKILKRYIKYDSEVRKAGGLLSWFTPDDDLTIQETMFALKPYNYDVICIDYVGLLAGVDGDDQWKSLLRVTRFCKRYAQIHNCVVILCCQLTDEGALALSKGMKRDANNMWTWKRDQRSRETGIIIVNQEKARNQSDFPFPLRLDTEVMTARDLTEEEMQEVANDNQEADNDNKKEKGKFGKNKFKDKKKVKHKQTDEEYYHVG